MSSGTSNGLKTAERTAAAANSFFTSGKMFNHVWVIKYDALYNMLTYNQCSNSQSTFDDYDGNKWCLKLIRGPVNQSLTISLNFTGPRDKRDVRIMFSITAVLETRGHLATFKTATPYDFGNQPTFAKEGFLQQQHNITSHGSSLLILCRMDVVEPSLSGLISSPDKGSAVAADLGKLFDSGIHSDVTLAVCNSEFKAHKAILSARSDVFAAMFAHKMAEQETNRVVITDTKDDVIQEMLRFVYTGKSPNIKEMAAELLAAADKYALKELKRMCSVVLIQSTNVESAAAILVLADRHNVEPLKAHVVNFINLNAAKVTASEGWKNLRETHAHLIFDIYEGLAAKLKSVDIK